MEEPHLHLDQVHFRYGAVPVLEAFSLRVQAGEFVSLVGASGSGKSTILKLLTGLLRPEAGTARVMGAAPAPGRIGYMPQRDCLMPWRTALENAAAGLEVQGVGPREARQRARELWPAFGLSGAEDRYPHQLSGGMRQRVAFLRTVLGGHSILLLDEPFGALDALTRAQMQAWLLGLWQELGKSVLFVTHDAEEAALLSDRVYVLKGAGVELPVGLPRPRSYAMISDPIVVERRAAILREVGLC
ncbi:ABC transporter ATP-binding protein [Stigmatella aurantiaca]|uniref:ABC transporter ATP-binding protein n=1 Tax=Stigmatella aurantiaca (strain DW4/3-1) TaxID=378806 RepID=Q08W53_STIAD|nr:ABC transporter ATP-binding protein [Stigmatella aurantiaca]ADO73556.1 ABC transporter ATP-binding protein [Stigmatella aurantiaca DW4/3-1]EAU64717.1 ABC transporter ATP-binding protein [Stigmatella aurantiaca DW4/3-1]